jgi:drug/metabolite transporter (DMT)-like permease/MFS family permease
MLTTTTNLSQKMARRPTLSPRTSYLLAAAIVGLALFASGAPSPLYGIYRELWGFSPLVLTLVYATYAFGVLTTLILAGRLSDQVGRRPVLLVALGVLIVATVLFILATSVVWLFAARALQGLATGVALSAASAALLELHPRRDPIAVSLANGVASAAGTGLGVLVSALLVELLPAPRVLPFVALLALFAITMAGVWLMPEPVAGRSRLRLTPGRPSVPAAIRGPFLLAALGAVSSWSIAGLFLSLGPQLSADLFQTTNHLIAGVGVFALAGSAAAAQIAFRHAQPWAAAAGGSLALFAGMVLLVIATAADSSIAYLAGAVIGGAGFGVAFLGALRALTAVIPNEHRASVMSAFYIVAYAALSLPAIAGGTIVGALGILPTFEIFGSVAAAVALLVAFQAYRTRPPTHRPRHRDHGLRDRLGALRRRAHSAPRGADRPSAITPLKVMTAGLAVVLMWASAFPAIRVAAPALGVDGLSFVRLAIAAVALLAVAPFAHVRRPERRHALLLLAAAFFGMTAYQVLLNAGELNVPPGTASIVVASAPLVSVAIAALALHERLTVPKIVGSIVAIAGVAVVSLSRSGASFTSALLIVAAAAVVQGIYHPLIKPMLRTRSGLEVATYAMVLGAIMALPLLPGGWDRLVTAPASAWGAALYLALVPSALGFVLWGYAVANLPMATSTSLLYLVPAVAVLIAFVWLGEVPHASELLGGLIVIAGAVLVGQGDRLQDQHRGRRHAHRSNAVQRPAPVVA